MAHVKSLSIAACIGRKWYVIPRVDTITAHLTTRPVTFSYHHNHSNTRNNKRLVKNVNCYFLEIIYSLASPSPVPVEWFLNNDSLTVSVSAYYLDDAGSRLA